MSKKLNIAILDENIDYINCFREYTIGNDGREYKIYFFTTFISLLELVKDIHILVVSESIFSEEYVSVFNKKNVLILTEEDNIEEMYGVHCLYRYQNVDTLISSIVDYCICNDILKKDNVNYKKKSHEKIISIYSSADTDNLARFPVLYAIHLANKGYKVIYFDLTEFSNETQYGLQETVGSVSDLLYYYLNTNAALSLKADMIIGKYAGIEYVPATRCSMDIRNCDTDTLLGFIKEIARLRGTDIIVLFVSGIVQDYLKIFADSVSTILSYEENTYSTNKKNRMREYIASQEDYQINDLREILVENGGNFKEECMEKMLIHIGYKEEG